MFINILASAYKISFKVNILPETELTDFSTCWLPNLFCFVILKGTAFSLLVFLKNSLVLRYTTGCFYFLSIFFSDLQYSFRKLIDTKNLQVIGLREAQWNTRNFVCGALAELCVTHLLNFSLVTYILNENI